MEKYKIINSTIHYKLICILCLFNFNEYLKAYIKHVSIIIITLFFFSACSKSTYTYKENKEYTIGVLLKSMDSQHWMDMRDGLKDAAQEANVNTIILYPSSESQLNEQESMFLNLLNQKPDAILFAPCDSQKGIKLLQVASTKNIPVVLIDTPIEGVNVPYIGADNLLIGSLAAEKMALLLETKGEVAIISGVSAQGSHKNRVQSFIDKLKEYPQIKLTVIKYGNSDFLTAIECTDEIMKEFPDVKGIFCTSAVMGLGAIEQKKQKFYSSNPSIIAVDTQVDALYALENESLQGLITQDGYEAGYKAIFTVIDLLNGKNVPNNVYIQTNYLDRKSVKEYIQKRFN